MIMKKLISALCLLAFTLGSSFSVQAGDNGEDMLYKQEHDFSMNDLQRLEVADESAKEFVESCVAKELPELYDALYINPLFCGN